MINIINENILKAKEDIIIHQVNVGGYMGGGVARQLATQYDNLEKAYSEFCKINNNDYSQLKGETLNIVVKDKIICNMFSQKENFDTDYESMKKALIRIREFAKDLNLTVCMPYGIGCGIANGDWNIVYKIIEEIFSDYDVALYRLEKNNGK